MTTPAAQPSPRTASQVTAVQTSGPQRRHERLNTVRALAFPLSALTLDLLLLTSGGAAALRDLLGGGENGPQRLAFVAAYTLGGALAGLPLAYALGYRQDVRAGLLHLKPAAWLKKWGVSALIGSAISGALYLGLNAVFRAAPDAWLPGAAALVTALLGALALAQPWLSRRMVKMHPLEDGRVQALAQALFGQAGVRLRRISVAQVAAESRVSNAFVQPGAGGAELVLSDTLLGGASDEELRFVIAHELGHYARRDLWTLLGWQWVSLLSMVGVAAALLGQLGHWAGLEGAGDIATVPLLAVSFTLAQRVLSVLGHALKRGMEYRADAFALRLTGNLDAMRAVLDKLGHDNLQDPNLSRLSEVLLHDHPSAARRLAAGARVLEGS